MDGWDLFSKGLVGMSSSVLALEACSIKAEFPSESLYSRMAHFNSPPVSSRLCKLCLLEKAFKQLLNRALDCAILCCSAYGGFLWLPLRVQ